MSTDYLQPLYNFRHSAEFFNVSSYKIRRKRDKTERIYKRCTKFAENLRSFLSSLWLFMKSLLVKAVNCKLTKKCSLNQP